MSNLIQKTQPLETAVDQIVGLYNQGQLEQAVSLAENLAEQYPNALILYEILGAAYMGLKNADKSIENYQKVIRLNPSHTDSHNNMGMALYDQGRFDEAVDSRSRRPASAISLRQKNTLANHVNLKRTQFFSLNLL